MRTATMKKFSLGILLVCGLALTVQSAAGGEPLRRVRLDVDNARVLVVQLERQGFDVLEGSVTDASLELVVSERDLQSLVELGYQPVTLAIGRPLKDIQADERDSIPTGYPDLAGIISQMNAKATAYPSICKVVDLTATFGTPTTYEGRHLYAVKVSANVNVEENEPAILIIANFHAREVNTPTIALYALDRFTTQYGVDPTITNLVNTNEIWIAPTWNPDGYNYVYNTDNMWRKNRRVFSTGTGVDVNRNFPIGWDSACAGDTDPASEVYKGPSAASEAEAQTLIAWSNDRHFSRIIDYHSYGREVVRDYLCLTHPFRSYNISEAEALATASGYAGAERDPSADGEHYEWQLAYMGAAANLIETGLDFQPPYTSAQSEAVLVWPGILWAIQRPVPLWGYVTDEVTGQPVSATLSYVGVSFSNGETNPTGRFGRYNAYIPPGTYTLAISAPGYESQRITNVVVTSGSTRLDIALTPPPPLTYPNGGEQVPVSVPTTITWTGVKPDWRYHVQATYNYGSIGNTTDSFERATLGADYATGGYAPWTISTAYAIAGTRSAYSGAITHSQSNWMTRSAGAGSLGFWYLVRSETGADFFNFYVDGVRMVHAAGIGGWAQYTTTLTAGTHELKWEYIKNASGSATPPEGVWVDYLQLVADTTAWSDVIALTPLGATSTAWTPTTLSNNCKIRIRSYHADATYGPWGDSDAVFSVAQVPLPGTPATPAPPDGATGVSIDTDLDWANASGATSYDVYFGDANPPPLAGNTVTSAWILPTLAYETTYYWKVVAKNAAGSTPGPVWSFTSTAAPYLVGDLNCDGSIGFSDINPFVLRLSSPTEYFNTYPTCPDANGDINSDGTVSFADINPFVALLSGGG
jgi:hypothetical protein